MERGREPEGQYKITFFSQEKHAHTSGKLATGKIWASCSSPGIWTLALSFLKRNKTSESMKTNSNFYFFFALFIPPLITSATSTSPLWEQLQGEHWTRALICFCVGKKQQWLLPFKHCRKQELWGPPACHWQVRRWVHRFRIHSSPNPWVVYSDWTGSSLTLVPRDRDLFPVLWDWCAQPAAPTALSSPSPSLPWWGSLLHPDGCFYPLLPSFTSFLFPFPETPPETNTFMLRNSRESKELIKN